jgi:hypothetical protein
MATRVAIYDTVGWSEAQVQAEARASDQRVVTSKPTAVPEPEFADPSDPPTYDEITPTPHTSNGELKVPSRRTLEEKDFETLHVYKKAYDNYAYYVSDKWIRRLFGALGHRTSVRMKMYWDAWYPIKKGQNVPELRIAPCYGKSRFMLVRSDKAQEWLKTG